PVRGRHLLDPQDLHSISTPPLHSSRGKRLMAHVLLRSSRCVPCIGSQWSSAMFERHQHAARCVYNLADSLDSILAACEDLLGGQLSIGLVAELAAVALDALEAHFVLYEDGQDSGGQHAVVPKAADRRSSSVRM